MKLMLEKQPEKYIEKGDVIVLDGGAKYLVIEGNYSDEIRLVNLETFKASSSQEDIENIVEMDDVERIIKSEDLVLGVR